MVILLTGATHTGKTVTAQWLTERYGIPYLSIDHLKMGLIRSGQTKLTPYDDEALTPYLWSIVKEIVKTAVENGQHLTVEGCYIPFDWQKDFDETYLSEICYYCLVMTDEYIRKHYDDICRYASAVEKRLPSDPPSIEDLRRDNARYLQGCKAHELPIVYMFDKFEVPIPVDRILPAKRRSIRARRRL